MALGSARAAPTARRSPPALALALVLAVVPAAAGGEAAAPAEGAPPSEQAAHSPPAGAPAPEAAALAERYAELQRQAAKLAAAYERAIAARVEALASQSPTLAHLRRTGLFTAESMLAGLPAEPLARLPWLCRALDEVEQRARELEQQFAGLARGRNEAAAIALLRRIAQAQERFREQDRDKDGVFDYAENLEDLGLPDLRPASEPGWYQAPGYRLRLLHGDVLSWSAEAVPEQPGQSGSRWFFIDERGLVRQSTSGPATAQSPPAPDQQHGAGSSRGSSQRRLRSKRRQAGALRPVPGARGPSAPPRCSAACSGEHHACSSAPLLVHGTAPVLRRVGGSACLDSGSSARCSAVSSRRRSGLGCGHGLLRARRGAIPRERGLRRGNRDPAGTDRRPRRPQRRHRRRAAGGGSHGTRAAPAVHQPLPSTRLLRRRTRPGTP
ncbi:MAG: hypothetical protein KatS3mg102_1690 [Planctomycetota bacterium]|nr:MAG: hypothetical protein KatS3mg102_1690 [Planctomycetota bacterium]